MKLEKNKFFLPVLIVLLVIFLPLAIYGTYSYIKLSREHGNPEHLHFLDNQLFYYNNGELLGIYKCKDENTCTDAVSKIDDINDYYKDGTKSIGVYNNEYVFIQDGDVVNLYDLKASSIISSYNSVKTYSAKLKDNTIIVENKDGKYGVLNMDNISYDIPLEYDFIGLKNAFNDGVLDNSKYIASNGDSWYILDSKGVELSSSVGYPIYDYSDDFIFAIDDEYYKFYNYSGKSVLTVDMIVKYELLNSYYVLTDKQGYIHIYDNRFSLVKEYGYFGGDFFYKVDDNILNIYDKTVQIGTFDLSK